MHQYCTLTHHWIDTTETLRSLARAHTDAEPAHAQPARACYLTIFTSLLGTHTGGSLRRGQYALEAARRRHETAKDPKGVGINAKQAHNLRCAVTVDYLAFLHTSAPRVVDLRTLSMTSKRPIVGTAHQMPPAGTVTDALP